VRETDPIMAANGPGCGAGRRPSPPELDAASTRRYLARGWAEAERLGGEHWAGRHRAEGHRATWAAACALLQHVRRLRPDWPGEAERAADLEQHLAWKALLERLALALSPR
jgi:hypothetical protein